MRTKKVCTVRGVNSQGDPVRLTVEAASVFEAAAHALEEWREHGSPPGVLDVTVYEPTKSWKVQPLQLAKWAASSVAGDSLGIQALKKSLREFLGLNQP